MRQFHSPARRGALACAAASFAAVALVAVLAACARQPAASVAAPQRARSLDRANLDTTCSPCQDFYQFANGGWLARNPIPPAYTRWGGFQELSDRNQEALHTILEDAARAARDGRGDANTQRIGRFYASCMDSAAVEAAGVTPLAPELARIDSVRSAADLPAALARLHRMGVRAGFVFTSRQDAKRSEDVLGDVIQGGLGLPDRDYYTKTDAASERLRQDYVAHVERTLRLVGEDSAAAAEDARRVMTLERALAEASMTRVQRRDPNAIYHRMTVAELATLAPGFDWARYFAEVGAPGVTTLNVDQPDFVAAFARLVASTPAEAWRAYLRWHLADDAAPALGSAFVNENFRFQSELTGAKELLPRWKRCVRVTDQALGEALGQAYVARTFTPQAKARALTMVRNMEAVLRERLGALAWMGDSTRAQAIAKLDAFANKIGYPDTWRDYSALDVRPGPFVENVVRANEFELRRQLGKIGKPVERGEWGMTPPTVNAYYNPLRNEIVFPAGILQPPFFDPLADDAVNYGGMGAVIGHEMTHGFDDSGSQYDAAGNLRNWWGTQDRERYTQRTTLIANQFGGYTIVDSTLHVNGRLTLGENIADLGGLTVAYYALERSMRGKPRPPKIDGFTPEQRFFLAWAQIWRTNTRPEYQRMLVNVDPHSPPKWRTNGPLSNMPEFARAWGCKPGDPMVRPDSLRAQIW